MKRLILILAIPLVVIGSLVVLRMVKKTRENAAMAAQRAARASAPIKVGVATAELRDIENTFEATGSLEAPLNVNIAPKIVGQIQYLQVQQGDRISKGQVLVRIDPTEVEAEVRQAQAALADAQYKLAQAQIIEAPTNVNVRTQIRSQAAGVASAQADYDQTRQNLAAQIASAQSSVTDAQGRVDNATAAIGSAKAAIDSANANLNNASIRLTRTMDLYKQGFTAAQDVDDAKAAELVQKAAVEVAQKQLAAGVAQRDSALAQRSAAEQQVSIIRTAGDANVESARQKLLQARASLEYAQANTAQTPAYTQSIAALKAEVAAARASLDAAKSRRKDTVLTSPLDGYVTGRMMDPGAVAQPGQAILSVEFFKQVWVSVAVPDTVSAKIHIGTDVGVKFDALPDRTFTASVVQVNRAADPQARQFTVRAIMSNTEDLFKPGMFAHVSIVTERVAGAVAVPREAVKTDQAGDYVTVVDEANKASRRQVTTGASDAAYIAITEGLQAGERVVTLTGAPIKDGTVVNSGEAGASSTGGTGGNSAGGQSGGPGGATKSGS